VTGSNPSNYVSSASLYSNTLIDAGVLRACEQRCWLTENSFSLGRLQRLRRHFFPVRAVSAKSGLIPFSPHGAVGVLPQGNIAAAANAAAERAGMT